MFGPGPGPRADIYLTSVPMQTPLLVSSGIGLLVVWRIVARIRRSIGRQPLAVGRSRMALVLFPLLAICVCFGALAQGSNPAGLFAGIAAGLLLGRYGLSTMQYHAEPDGTLCYTPNPYIGIVLVLALVTRLAFRLLPMLADGELAAGPPPLTLPTLLMLGTLFAYYWTIAFGLLRWRARAMA